MLKVPSAKREYAARRYPVASSMASRSSCSESATCIGSATCPLRPVDLDLIKLERLVLLCGVE
jgi:hypothetical protein